MKMDEKDIEERFGVIAIKKGYITREQLLEAMTEQITSDLGTEGHSLLGAILCAKRYMTTDQVNEVVGEMSKPAVGTCPKCGVMVFKCPNCGTTLR